MIGVWKVATTRVFDEWFAGLGGGDQAEVMAKVNLLKILGPQLKRPHADTLKGSRHANLRELRASTARSVMRIAFAFDPRRSAILLIGGDKGGVSEHNFYRRLIARADALYDAHLLALREEQKPKGA